jgi:hypothetical protein
VIDAIRAVLRDQHRKNEQFRHGVAEMNLDGVRRLSDVSDEELIATDTSIPSARNQMEMQRRLKVAIEGVTTEIVAARKSANSAAVAIIVLTAALVALTVVLALK